MSEIRVTVATKPFGDDMKLYRRKNFILKPGLNSLVGCNGSGKTTFIDQFLIPELRKQKIEYYKYNDRRQGGSALMQQLLDNNDITGVAQMFISSEGERIVYAISNIMKSLRAIFNNNKGKSIFLIFDAIDSGMSVDEITEIREVFLDLMLKDSKEVFDVDLYIVIAANNYEWCCDERIHNIDITDAKEIKIKSYEDFREHIYKSRKTKDLLRGVTSINEYEQRATSGG